MRQIFPAILACSALLGCAQLQPQPASPEGPGAAAGARPQARPAAAARPVPASARTAEQFDVTTAEERAAAAAPAPAAAQKPIGTTLASLGDPAEAGFWLKTPLVSERRMGRVTYAGSGKSAQVELIPIPGAASDGSRISLAAMRLLEAPLTGLPELEVFGG